MADIEAPITIALSEHHESRIIYTHAPHGMIRRIIMAESDDHANDMRLTDIFPASGQAHVIDLPEAAMQNLVRFYGAGDEQQEIAQLNAIIQRWIDTDTESETDLLYTQSQLAEAKEDLARLDEVLAASNALNWEMATELATLREQESFRVALLESVASAARAFQQEDTDLTQIGIWNALENLDAWQPNDASTGVSVPETHPKMPSLAYVHTKTVIYNQKLRAVADAARDYRDNKHHFTALAEALDALDTWEADATAAMISDDAEDMSAPVAPGVCPECSDTGGAHDDWCSRAEPDPRDDIGGLMDDPSNFQR